MHTLYVTVMFTVISHVCCFRTAQETLCFITGNLETCERDWTATAPKRKSYSLNYKLQVEKYAAEKQKTRKCFLYL